MRINREQFKYPDKYKQVYIDRFSEGISLKGDCWEWTKAKNTEGYGYLWTGKQTRVHRMSYELFNGDINDLIVCHKCDNPWCVNPEHLFLGDKDINNKDRASKGRNRNQNGESNNVSKLTDLQVLEIFNSNLPRKQLALKFNTCRQNIDNIKNKKRWKHLLK